MANKDLLAQIREEKKLKSAGAAKKDELQEATPGKESLLQQSIKSRREEMGLNEGDELGEEGDELGEDWDEDFGPAEDMLEKEEEAETLPQQEAEPQVEPKPELSEAELAQAQEKHKSVMSKTLSGIKKQKSSKDKEEPKIPKAPKAPKAPAAAAQSPKPDMSNVFADINAQKNSQDQPEENAVEAGPKNPNLSQEELQNLSPEELNSLYNLSEKDLREVEEELDALEKEVAAVESAVEAGPKNPNLSQEELQNLSPEDLREVEAEFNEMDAELNPVDAAPKPKAPPPIPKVAPPPIPEQVVKKRKPLPPIPGEVEKTAKDKVLLLNEGQLGASEININEVVDPITQAIRDEIITKQQLYLQQHMAENIADPKEKEDFLKQDLQKVRAYLATDEGKDAMKEVMKDPKFQQEMSTIESAGYSAVHAQFDSFKDVEWGKATAAKVRTTEVTDSNGDPVCSLKETTIDAEPTLVTLEDGTTRTVKSFRKIDFPVELESGNGPMHVSMAAKDENGRNVPEKDAVYFTAHYDDNGKLTEVSSPVPVKFMGDGADAIAYIERNGKAFTLPITQGKYKAMMIEVAKNKGVNVNLSQEIEKPKAKNLNRVTPKGPKGPEQNPDLRKNLKPVTPNNNPKAPKQNPDLRKNLKPVTPNNNPKAPKGNDFEKQLRDAKTNLNRVEPRVGGRPSGPSDLEKEIQAAKRNLKRVEPKVVGTPSGPSDFEKLLKATRENLKSTKNPKGQQAGEFNVNPNKPEIHKSTKHVIPGQGVITQTAKKVKIEQPKIMKAVKVQVQPERHQASEGLIAQKVTNVNIENPQLAKKIEVTRKTLEPLKATEPKFVGNVNLITGKKVGLEVIERAHKVRVNVGGKPPTLKNTGVKENALEMINGKSSKKVASIIADALKKGKAELVSDIIGLIDKPPKDAKIPNVGRVLLNKIYIDGMEAASKLGPQSKKQAARMERACGAIAPRAGITDHANRIKASKAEKGPVKM